jgi:hypothetical protein
MNSRLANWYIGRPVSYQLYRPTNFQIHQPTKENNMEELRDRLTTLKNKLEHIRGRL